MADIAVGALLFEDGFTDLSTSARQTLECYASSGYYSGYTGRKDLVDEETTVDGHQAWHMQSEVYVEMESLPQVDGDVVDIYVVDVGSDDHLGVFISSVTIGDSDRDKKVRDCIAGLTKLVRAIHEAGSAVIAQLNHAGSGAEPETPGVNLSASAVLSPRKTETGMPREMTRAEILMTEADFVRAALRAVRAGCDGVEIHSAHGYLLNQFYSPLTNRRTDAYGPQTMENRLRFHLETVDAVRKAVGQDVPIALRLGGADYLPGGSTEEDAVEACKMLEAAGVNLIDLSGGMCGYVRPEHAEPGYFSSMSEKVKAAVDVPVLLTGGVNTIADAKQLLAEGKADLIGVGRALYRDAHWLEHA